MLSLRKVDARIAVDLRNPLHRSMRENGSDGGIDSREHALCFAERVGVQDAGFALGSIRLPPLVELREDVFRRVPSVNGQRESSLRHEAMTSERLEFCTGRVGSYFIVA